MKIDDVLTIIYPVVTIIAFLFGKYVFPKHKTSIQNAVAQFEILLRYAESFCAYARQFLNCSGSEKMDAVVEKLKAICVKEGIDVDEETLRAIGQKAYDAMIAGENSSKVIIETAVEELKTFTPVEGVTETINSTDELEPIELPDADQVV